MPKKYLSILKNSIGLDLKNDLIEKINQKSLYELDGKYKRVIKNRIINDLPIIERDYIGNFLYLISYILIFVVSLGLAIYIQKSLTLIMLALSFIPLLTPFISKKILSNKKESMQEAKNDYLESFDEFSDNIRFISIARIFDHFSKKLKNLGENTKKKTIDYQANLQKTFSISYGLGNVLYSGTWIIGGFFVYNGFLSLPELIAMTTLMVTIAGPIQSFSITYSEFISSRRIFTSFLNLLDEDYKPADNEKESLASIDELRVKNLNLNFNYNTLLENTSLSFRKDSKYLILGESGSGKSTFLNSLLGMYSYANDHIFINDKSLLDINKNDYYEKIHFIPQDTVIFKASILENVSLFDKNADVARVRKALDMVQLTYLIKEDDGGLARIISKDRISGGEKKRIDLARSFYLNKSLIIMDEPTSGLDSYNEDINANIIKKTNDKIIIVVSHSTNENFLSAFDQRLIIENKTLKPVG
ncbi:MAG: ABC transporter ATP-binding protein [Anaerococcus sp.]|nr:ABC transporter ATP-binding protein [Anaerococcus sp.]